ncbi:hypothetical protein ABOM_002600 [Aspergillus bombycis]|uniref:CENP-V/GFA domain-containing protein n=1 Tax=Aspergillus bombycis TaxID=109264 RepID=A0A1F8A7Q3_9EURO|nr:hypothetical protein ABOM_002600 [Aspergillus bombycis]OGM47449.1 hypothetical protein ABOM_002600 [Aspergillus bombycis]
MTTSDEHHSSLPYHGSCHCGFIRYITFIPMPPAVAPDGAEGARLRFYKCSCTTCHKMGLFHMRLPDAPNQFFLLSPLDRNTLANYKCPNGYINWFFCPTCGVRCFATVPHWKQDQIDIESISAAIPSRDGKPDLPGIEESTKTITVWRMDPETFQEDVTGYLTINALTIDQDQPHGNNLDLRQLVDNKLVEYMDWNTKKGDCRYDYPHDKGTW